MTLTEKVHVVEWATGNKLLQGKDKRQTSECFIPIREDSSMLTQQLQTIEQAEMHNFQMVVKELSCFCNPLLQMLFLWFWSAHSKPNFNLNWIKASSSDNPFIEFWQMFKNGACSQTQKSWNLCFLTSHLDELTFEAKAFQMDPVPLGEVQKHRAQLHTGFAQQNFEVRMQKEVKTIETKNFIPCSQERIMILTSSWVKSQSSIGSWITICTFSGRQMQNLICRKRMLHQFLREHQLHKSECQTNHHKWQLVQNFNDGSLIGSPITEMINWKDHIVVCSRKNSLCTSQMTCRVDFSIICFKHDILLMSTMIHFHVLSYWWVQEELQMSLFLPLPQMAVDCPNIAEWTTHITIPIPVCSGRSGRTVFVRPTVRVFIHDLPSLPTCWSVLLRKRVGLRWRHFCLSIQMVKSLACQCW